MYMYMYIHCTCVYIHVHVHIYMYLSSVTESALINETVVYITSTQLYSSPNYVALPPEDIMVIVRSQVMVIQ